MRKTISDDPDNVSTRDNSSDDDGSYPHFTPAPNDDNESILSHNTTELGC